jgi:hypothetical protein
VVIVGQAAAELLEGLPTALVLLVVLLAAACSMMSGWGRLQDRDRQNCCQNLICVIIGAAVRTYGLRCCLVEVRDCTALQCRQLLLLVWVHSYVVGVRRCARLAAPGVGAYGRMPAVCY